MDYVCVSDHSIRSLCSAIDANNLDTQVVIVDVNKKCASCGAEHATAVCQSVNKSACPFCHSVSQHDKSECRYFAQVTESYQLKLANRRKARYQRAVAAVSLDIEERETTDGPSQMEHPLISDNTQFPPLNNRFSMLEPIEVAHEGLAVHNRDPSPSTSRFTQRPRNPYAKVLREANRQQSQTSPAPKRRRTDLKSSTVPSQQTQKPPSSFQNGLAFQNSSDSSSASSKLASVIIEFVRQSGMSQIWISIIESIIDPLLQAIMPQLPALISALCPVVLNRAL